MALLRAPFEWPLLLSSMAFIMVRIS